MATKLYPPYIEGTLPAIIKQDDQLTITIPFILNRAVSSSEVSALRCKIKTVNTNQNILLLNTTEWSNGEVVFAFNNTNPLQIGQSYKIQLACVDSTGVEGYYSTVGIAKCTSNATLTITRNGNTFTGVFTNTDITEKPYSYQFQLLKNDKAIEDSGVLLHNIETNTLDTYTTYHDILSNDYTIKYQVTTINNYTVQDSSELTAQKVNNLSNINITPEMNFDNGYMSIKIQSTDNLNGTYILARTAGSLDGTDTDVWYPLATLNYTNDQENSEVYKDFTVTQGYKYSYRLYKDENNVRYQVQSMPVMADFEDMFLYDGIRQLRIRFNPQVSSFKTNILESKAEAIGSKYPFFFRNGRVSYKEFPINGLISYWMNESDHSGLFLSDDQIGLEDGVFERLRTKEIGVTLPTRVRTTNQSGYNFAAERTFKLSVLDWLNDGKPKLFRSPGEGTYLVRLMDVSLSPEQQLSRMIHNFSCTAYEISDISYESLKKNKILTLPHYTVDYLNVKTLDLNNMVVSSNTNLFDGINNIKGFFIDCISPGLQIKYSYTHNSQSVSTSFTLNTTIFSTILPEELIAASYNYTGLYITTPLTSYNGITVTIIYG